jgi:tetratricopeptide (TPR) repeat protein
MAKKPNKTTRNLKEKPKKKPSGFEFSSLRELIDHPQFKPIVIGALSGIALPLLAYFVYSSNTNAQYVHILIYVSLCVFTWSLPNFKLGLTAVFLFTQPLLLFLGNTEYGYTKAMFSIASISVLGLVWIGSWFREKEVRIQLTNLLWPGLLILGAALLSLINSAAFFADFQYVVLVIYFIFFYLFIANLFANESQIKLALRVLLFSGFLAGLYALMQYFGVLLGKPGAENGTAAVISSFGNKNYLAGFLAYLFVPGLILFFKPEKSWDRLYSMGMLVFITISLLACTSESAWFALLVALGVAKLGLILVGEVESARREWKWSLLFSGVLFGSVLVFLILHMLVVGGGMISLVAISKALASFSLVAWLAVLGLLLIPAGSGLIWLYRSAQRRMIWVGAAVVVALLFGSLLTPVGQSATGRLGEFIQESTVKTRSQDWLIGLEMFYDNPLIGASIGDYKREFLEYKAEFLASPAGAEYDTYIRRAAQAHNDYVQILAEMGILGLLAVLSLIAMILWTAWRRLRAADSSGVRWAIIALFAGVVAFMSDAFFSFPLHLPANVLALVFLLGVLQSRALGTPAMEFRLSKTAVGLIFGVAVVVSAVVVTFGYRDWVADLDLDRGRFIYQAESDLETSEQLFLNSIANDFAPSEAYFWLGQLYYQQFNNSLSVGNVAKSLELNEKAIDYFQKSLAPFETESTHFYLAALYQGRASQAQDQDYWDLALAHADRLVAMDPAPTLRPDLYQLRGIITYNRGDEAEGIAQLEELSQAYRTKARIWSTLTQMYIEQISSAESEEESIAWCVKAKETLDETGKIIRRRYRKIDGILQDGASLPLNQVFTWQNERNSLENIERENNRRLASLSC